MEISQMEATNINSVQNEKAIKDRYEKVESAEIQNAPERKSDSVELSEEALALRKEEMASEEPAISELSQDDKQMNPMQRDVDEEMNEIKRDEERAQADIKREIEEKKQTVSESRYGEVETSPAEGRNIDKVV